MKTRKFMPALMAAIMLAASPVNTPILQLTAYASSERDYDVSDAEWSVEYDDNDKIQIYATWEPSDDNAKAVVTVYRNDKATGIKVTTATNKESVELTSQIKKLNKTGDYTFRIKASKKSKDEDGQEASEYSEATSDSIEIDSSILRNLKSGSKTSSKTTNKSKSSVNPGATTTNTNAGALSPYTNSTAPTGNIQNEASDFLTTGTWSDWGLGWVYLLNGTPVTNKWVFDSVGKLYHIGANGFMDTNCNVSDYTGTHYVDASGVMLY